MTDNADSFAVPTDFEQPCPEFLGTAINTLFDRAAERWSARIAIKEFRHHWTYRELQQHVDRVASLLAQAGAADQDRPVVLWLPNGASVIAAMLATLKAGGFYVVIDPRYPVERNSAILNNSEAGWVITGPVLTRLKPAVRPGLDKKLPFIFVPKTRSRPRYLSCRLQQVRRLHYLHVW